MESRGNAFSRPSVSVLSQCCLSACCAAACTHSRAPRACWGCHPSAHRSTGLVHLQSKHADSGEGVGSNIDSETHKVGEQPVPPAHPKDPLGCGAWSRSATAAFPQEAVSA